jgi:hypothetical protein
MWMFHVVLESYISTSCTRNTAITLSENVPNSTQAQTSRGQLQSPEDLKP